MELREIYDPRDKWHRARRIELVRHAHMLGHNEISEMMPKELIIKRLKDKGVQPPLVPYRTLGEYNPRSGDTTPSSHMNGGDKPQIAEKTVTVDADDIMERDWLAQQKPSIEAMGYNEMRAELKAAGVKLNRRWSKDDVKAELEKLRSVNNPSDGSQ